MNRIISIRGTSGSGKSTVVRRIMELFDTIVPHHIVGRRQPIGYRMGDVSVIGHYETACGGCDTIHSFTEVFDHVRREYQIGYHVLFEGVLLYSEMPLTIGMVKEGMPLEVIAMTTPIDVCVASVNARRQLKANFTPVDPANTISKYNGTISAMKRLQQNGVPVLWASRQEAFDHIIDRFNINPQFKHLWM